MAKGKKLVDVMLWAPLFFFSAENVNISEIAY